MAIYKNTYQLSLQTSPVRFLKASLLLYVGRVESRNIFLNVESFFGPKNGGIRQIWDEA